MGIALRIDEATIGPDHVVKLSVTQGTPPLPATPGGMVLEFPRDQIAAKLEEARALLENPDVLLALALSAWLKADASVGNPAYIKGKVATVDLTGLATTIAVK